MNREHLILGTFLALFDLSQKGGVPRISTVAGRVGAPPEAIRVALSHLEGRGLVDADGVRLTMRGLAIAAALRAASTTELHVAA